MSRLENIRGELLLPKGRMNMCPMTTNTRVWRCVESFMTGYGMFEDRYFVSNYGDIVERVSLDSFKTVYREHYSKRNVMVVRLDDYGTRDWVGGPGYARVDVDRLVKQAFNYIENDDDFSIGHIDMNIHNCALPNLLWVRKGEEQWYHEAFEFAQENENTYTAIYTTWGDYFHTDMMAMESLIRYVSTMRANRKMTLEDYMRINPECPASYPILLARGKIRPYIRKEYIQRYGSIPTKCKRNTKKK